MKPTTFEIDGETVHAYGCMCDRCRNMFLAILADNPDGTPFFTDDELEKLASAY